jgi:hypothetical protein
LCIFSMFHPALRKQDQGKYESCQLLVPPTYPQLSI